VKGVPVRIEIGPRDIAAGQAILALRDTGEKLTVPLAGLKSALQDQLAAMQTRLYQTAAKTLAERTADVSTYAELEERVAANAGWNRVGWCGDEDCETRVKTETKATIRCIPFDQPDSAGACVICDKPAKYQVIIARAY
jgi:prolyl-tRNA synthetase